MFVKKTLKLFILSSYWNYPNIFPFKILDYVIIIEIEIIISENNFSVENDRKTLLSKKENIIFHLPEIPDPNPMVGTLKGGNWAFGHIQFLL